MANKSDTRSMLLNDSPLKLLLTLSLPAIIGMVVVGLYNLMDAVFVGQMVGSNAMTAVSVSYPFTLVNTGVATLIGAGSASILSRAIGKIDQAIDIFSPRKFEVLKNYLTKYGLCGGFVREDKQSQELCICMEEYSEDVKSEQWHQLSDVIDAKCKTQNQKNIRR